MKIPSLAIIAVSALSLTLPVSTVVAQDRLPIAARGNSVVSGQLFGCAVRLERYFYRTLEQARLNGRNLPPSYELNLVAGLNVDALKVDTRQAVEVHLAGTLVIQDFENMILQMADVEYDAASAGAPGYHEAWGQASACGLLFNQFNIYALYS